MTNPNPTTAANTATVTVTKTKHLTGKTAWFYWFCFPGCLPDSDPFGPFATEQEAIDDARDGLGDDDDSEQHTDYPHEPGYLYGCPACEASCHCGPGVADGRETQCVWSGHDDNEGDE